MAEKVKLSKLDKWFRTLRRLVRILFKPLFPYKYHGHTDLYSNGPYIFVSNHLSYLDVVYIVMATDRAVHFLAKKDLFKKGIMKKFVTKCECVSVSRDGTDVKAVMQSLKYLKNGESLAIFPEGTRNKTDEIMLPFKSGAAALSIKAKVPIVPIVHLKNIRMFRREHVLCGEPIEFSEFYDKRLTEADTEECDNILRLKMIEMYNNLYAEVKDKKKK